MKTTRIILALIAAVPLVGCESEHHQGGVQDHTYYQTGRDYDPDPYNGPAQSPSFRPGMNRHDPRDAQFNTYDEPQSVVPADTTPAPPPPGVRPPPPPPVAPAPAPVLPPDTRPTPPPPDTRPTPPPPDAGTLPPPPRPPPPSGGSPLPPPNPNEPQ